MKLARLALIAFFFLLTEPFSWAQFTYSVSDLGTTGGTISAGNAVDQYGRVAGASYITDDAAQNAFISGADGAKPLRNLGTLGGSSSFGQGINSSGMVAGTSQVEGDVNFRAFLSAPNG